jgi:hemolysin activation/secretion protein
MSRAAVSLHAAKMSRRFLPLALAATLSPICQAIAQTAPANVPNAGEIVREVPAAPSMPPLPAQAPVEAQGGNEQAPALRFVLREFLLRGNTILTPFQISSVTDPYMGKPVDEKALGALMATVRKRYEDQGYTLVSLGFPAQEVGKGVLTIDVVEPKLARVQIVQGADTPVTRARVEGLMSFFDLRAGTVLSTASLERVMFALNDTPGVQAKASLAPTGDEGVYNVTIQTQPKRWWDASVSLDNQGSRSAGQWRISGLARLTNPLGIGDNLDAQALFSSGGAVKVGRVAYELPVAYTPARLSVAYAHVDYDIGGEFAEFQPFGSARVVEANLSYPLLRSRTRTLMARIGAEQKNLRDEFGLVAPELSRQDKRIHSLSAGLNYESRDAFVGGGYNGASALLHWGQMRFKSEADRVEDAALGAYGTGGRFAKAEVQYTRLQFVTPRVAAFASISQQHATRNLDSAEKMTLGGPRGVRAYPTAEGASDEGTLLNTELRYWINRNWTVFALYDWAKGSKARDVDVVADNANEIYLRGAGLGLVASYPGWASVKATIAWRGKQRSETDTNNDKMRLFLQAQHAF